MPVRVTVAPDLFTYTDQRGDKAKDYWAVQRLMCRQVNCL